MMKFLIIAIFVLTSCLPTSTKRTTNVAQNNTDGTTTDPATDPNYTISDVDIGWYYLYNTTNTLTFSRTNTNVVYLKGKTLENYLKTITNFTQKTYCIEMDFGTHGKFRTRAIPLSVNNYSSGKKTIYLKVDIGNDAANESACEPTDPIQPILNYNGSTWVTSGATAEYDLNEICPTCLNNLEVDSMRFYEVLGTSTQRLLKQVEPSLMNLSLLTFFVQSPSANSGNSLCSQSSCQSSGYDCCLEGQCVNDASLRANLTTSAALTDAQSAVASNPLAFLLYPQYYYICPQVQPSTPDNTGTEPTNPAAEAAARFEALKLDYYCINELKTNSLSDPYQLDVINPSYTYTKCSTNDADDTNTMYWKNVMTRLYDSCGCENQPFFADKLTYCPKYYYQVAESNSQGVPTRIECAVIDENTIPLPFQNLNVIISGKTAPHRLFNKNGEEINPYKTVTNSVTENESNTSSSDNLAEFSYLDETKTIPNNGSFNMNSILGEITVDLDFAKPAKVIDVEIDQNYLIATTSGIQSPCPTCSTDSWYASFTATPTTSVGRGLQAVGHSTTRDEFGLNNTLGNWEDTIFGRACWVPPTMIPYGHKKYSTTQTQRINRLTSQAAMYVNGYQRDWYGFNRGAMIGSWDGVNWFAIGTSRIVKSKTKKLFLAINAPFADLADDTTHVVSVQVYDNISTGASKDYDPSITFNNLLQNDSGTCQQYHQCSTDTDCITRLGWEYACANVTDTKISTPIFDAETALEKENQELKGGIINILSQTSLGGSSTKRCVYRGAGSICSTNAHTNTSLGPTSNKTKLLTCAPNFFCASVNSSVFNKEVSRFAAPLEDLPVSPNHFFGRDANMLGRPLHYVTANNALPQVARDAITDAVRAHGPTGNTLTAGLCRPGKGLPTSSASTRTNPYDQQAVQDTYTLNGSLNVRTDYTNQIASCDSSLNHLNKLMSCPVINAAGNLVPFTSDFYITSTTTFNSTLYQGSAALQNSCGRESQTTGSVSAFANIEAGPLKSSTILSPKFARDACFRKAGSVCHTDLDCSPNKMHAEQSALLNAITYFGSAENKKYYEEYLVCGQQDPKPFMTDSNFTTYDMSKNRCCREVGKDITTYTPAVADNILGTNLTNSTIMSMDISLKSATTPTNANRYERYSVSTASNLVSADSRRNGSGVLLNSPNIMTPDQWKSIGDVNQKTCCGGGWIRKFSDGTNNWTRTDRLQLDVSNFSCLNYQLPHMTANPTEFLSNLFSNYNQFNAEYSQYCKSTSSNGGNCVQASIPNSTYYANNTCNGNVETCTDDGSNKLCTPTTATALHYVATLPAAQSSATWGWVSNPFSLFQPLSNDTSSRTWVDMTITDPNEDAYRRNVSIKVPSYIPIPTFTPNTVRGPIANPTNIKILVTPLVAGVATSSIECANYTTTHAATVALLNSFDKTSIDGTDPGELNICDINPVGNKCCYFLDQTTRELKVVLEDVSTANDSNYTGPNAKWGVLISYIPAGTAVHKASSPSAPQAKPTCSNSYYLEKLGRLELSGVPQISYEKVVCNNDISKVVPGIFKDSITSPTLFNSSSFAFKDASNNWRTTHHGLENEPVFSEQDFKCCTPLGKETKNPTTCCSGYGVSAGQNTNRYTCKLPSGTDLSVYFNRFISNEGSDTTGPAGGLKDIDFETQTGEPKFTTAVNQKMMALGQAYCETGTVRTGAAFGNFLPDPISMTSGEKVYGIVDSSSDSGTTSANGATVTVGYQKFQQGYRWNHHFYCQGAD